MKTAIVCFALGVGFAYTVFDGESPAPVQAPAKPETDPKKAKEPAAEPAPAPDASKKPADPNAKPAEPDAKPADPNAKKEEKPEAAVPEAKDVARPLPHDGTEETGPSVSVPTVTATATGGSLAPDIGSYENGQEEAARIVAEATSGLESQTPLSDQEMKALLRDVLGGADSDVSALDVLEKQVLQERLELNALIGQGPDAKSLLDKIPGFNDELEKIGIPADIAEQIRNLSAKVIELHGEKSLRDWTKYEEIGKKSEPEGFKSITDPSATAEAAPPPPKTRPRSSLPKLEAALLFQSGNADEALEILSKLPEGDLAAQDRFILGSCLVAKRQFEQAAAVLKPLAESKDSDMLAQAAKRQLKRMEMIEAGLVGLDPLEKARVENQK